MKIVSSVLRSIGRGFLSINNKIEAAEESRKTERIKRQASEYAKLRAEEGPENNFHPRSPIRIHDLYEATDVEYRGAMLIFKTATGHEASVSLMSKDVINKLRAFFAPSPFNVSAPDQEGSVNHAPAPESMTVHIDDVGAARRRVEKANASVAGAKKRAPRKPRR